MRPVRPFARQPTISRPPACSPRAVDLYTMPLGSWYDPAAPVTLMVEGMMPMSIPGRAYGFAQLDEGTKNNCLALYYQAGTTAAHATPTTPLD
jgi:hypothetical protein